MIHYFLQVPKTYNTAASYNRVRLFKQGFEEMSIKTSIHLLFIRNGNIFNKIAFFVAGYWKILSVLLKVKKEDIVIVYGETYFTPIYPIIKKRTHFVIERTEFPAYLIDKGVSKNGEKNSRRNEASLKYADLMITCSSSLRDYYLQYVDNVVVSPLVVDLNEISHVNARPKLKKGKYVVYCGSFGNNKDGLPILIESFAMVVKQHIDLVLVLIGTGPQKDIDILNDLINKNDINNKVVFTGALPHDELLVWLCNATMLVLARPNSKQAEGGIPSKVGEYLASGVPCVITNVGDLPSYLRDGFDCFIAEPDSPISFAKKMIECLKSDMASIGQNAMVTAKQFNYDVQSHLLYDQLKKTFLL